MTQPDWEAIERAYRAGSISIRSIAEKHDTKEGTIRSRAKKNGWQRDLTEQVKNATQAKLSRTASRKAVTHDAAREDAEIVDEASDEAADVVLAHRVVLAQWRGLANKLCDALDEIVVDASNHSEFARSLNSGVDAQMKVIKGEREAYGINTEPGADSRTPSGLSHFYGDSEADA